MAQQFIATSFLPEEFEVFVTESVSKAVKEELSLFTPSYSLVKILTRQETADLLSISLPTLNDYTKRGLIPAYRIGSNVRYKLNEVESALLKVKTSSKKYEIDNQKGGHNDFR